MQLYESARKVQADAESMKRYIGREGRQPSGDDLDSILVLVQDLAAIVERLALIEATVVITTLPT
jgi:hypothetical protein